MNSRLQTWRQFATCTLLLGAIATALPGGIRAQETATPPSEGEDEEIFFDTVQVNLVNVDVIVTDKKGKIVTGLTKDDFELLEDKRPMAISNFYAVEDGIPVAGGLDPEELELAQPSGVPTLPGQELSAVPEDQRLHMVVYIDNFNIRPFNRNRVFRSLRSFLSGELSDDDRVMLVSYDRSLKVRRSFTSDPTLIAAALTELETVSGHGVHFDSERRDLMRDIEEAESVGEVEWRVRQFAESGFNDLSFTLDSIKEMTNSLAGLTGRKVILYVSDGIPQTPGEDLFYAVQQKFGATTLLTEAQTYNTARRLQELSAQANAHRVSFYTIDAGGLRVGSASSAEVASAPTAGLSSFVDSVYISNIQAPLQMLAEETGGRAILNTNDPTDDLKEVSAEFRSYYSLGFTPSHTGDGRLYRIKVKAKRKDLRVRYRQSYRDKSLRSRMEDGTRATLNYDVETNPLKILLEKGKQQPQDDGNYLVDLVVKIPLGELTMIPRETFRQGQVRLYFTAMDEEGDTSEVQEVPLSIRIPEGDWEVAEGQYWGYDVQLMMRAGGHAVGIGVRDDLGAINSFIKHEVLVGRGG